MTWKRDGLGITIGERGRAVSRSEGISGRAADGAGPGEGRVRRESREGRLGGGADSGAMVSERRWRLSTSSEIPHEQLRWIRTEIGLQNIQC